jgi:hypothetical protein
MRGYVVLVFQKLVPKLEVADLNQSPHKHAQAHHAYSHSHQVAPKPSRT